MNDTPTPTNDEWIVTDNENYIEIASIKTCDSIASVHGGKTIGDQYDLAVRIARVPQLERELTAVTEQRDKALQKIKNQAERIAYLEGATNHATGTPLSKAIEQRDRLAAGLEVAQQVGIQLGEQRDRLAEALINCMPFISGEGCGEYSDAKEALQSLTPNAKP